MKFKIISIGRDRSGLFDPAVHEYVARISRHVKCELVELPEEKKGTDPQRARVDEGWKILKQVQPDDRLVALDERGKALSSTELARWLDGMIMEGRDVIFAVGGAEGLSDAVRTRADLVLSLSRMTLAHRLARLVMAEQLYRAIAILRGDPYHR